MIVRQLFVSHFKFGGSVFILCARGYSVAAGYATMLAAALGQL
jgi:hypothetical protein